MTDHPSTYEGTQTGGTGIAWDDRASLHRKDDGDGVLSAAKALRQGSFAELIRHLMLLPKEERAAYVIEKSGDRTYTAQEVSNLAQHPDFPSDG